MANAYEQYTSEQLDNAFAGNNAYQIAKENDDVKSYLSNRPVYEGETFWDWITGKVQAKRAGYENALKAYDSQYEANYKNWAREDTAYQRLYQDLSKAGVNPYWIIANQGISPVSSNAYEASKERKTDKDTSSSDFLKLVTTMAFIIKLLA